MTATLPSAAVHGLFHIAIKTSDLKATRAFWRRIIGLREVPRPDFGFAEPRDLSKTQGDKGLSLT